MKLVALADLLSEIAGRNVLGHSWHYARNAEERIANATAVFGRIRELLECWESRREDNRQIWPPLWLPIERESRSELAAHFSESTEEEIDNLVSFHFPKEEIWLRLEFFSEETGRLELHLAPLFFHIAVSCNDGSVTIGGGVNDQFAAPFILRDADLHLLRVRGDDWIGIYPDSYGLSGRQYFPREADLTDCYPWGEYDDMSQLKAVVQPCEG